NTAASCECCTSNKLNHCKSEKEQAWESYYNCTNHLDNLLPHDLLNQSSRLGRRFRCFARNEHHLAKKISNSLFPLLWSLIVFIRVLVQVYFSGDFHDFLSISICRKFT